MHKKVISYFRRVPPHPEFWLESKKDCLLKLCEGSSPLRKKIQTLNNERTFDRVNWENQMLGKIIGRKYFLVSYKSLGRPQPEHRMQVWNPQEKKLIEMAEKHTETPLAGLAVT